MVRYIILWIVTIVIVLIPLRVIGYGFLPGDDALRHSAKVISGKNWDEILVIRDDIKLDSHPGWHFLLGVVYKWTKWPAKYLVVFSVVALFLLFCLIPVIILKRPEAWLMALLTILVANPSFIMRLFLGRPYILTMSSMLVLFLLWHKLPTRKTPYAILLILTLLMAASTWIHCSWHLLVVPVICFFLARQWRAGILVAIAVTVGVMLGALLTLHPFIFLKQTLLHAVRAFSNHDIQRMLVTEFRPFGGDVLVALAVLGMLLWRKVRGTWSIKVIDNPIFILGITGWILGYVSTRFWVDWGMPAILVWMALEFQEALDKHVGFLSLQRLVLSIVVVGSLYLVITSDLDSRWTRNLNIEYLSFEKPEHAGWLPDPGGIVYSDDMTIFYQTFFKNPHAPWRYVLGFEPTMMPPEDLAIYRKIQWNYGAPKLFEAWIKKMKPEDRVIIRGVPYLHPGIHKLEWNYTATGIWIGRLPRDSKKPSSS